MMELGTREILLAVGLLLIVVIVLDGIRRIRQSSHGQIRMARRQRVFEDEGEYEPYAAEQLGQKRVRDRDTREEPKLRSTVLTRPEPVAFEPEDDHLTDREAYQQHEPYSEHKSYQTGAAQHGHESHPDLQDRYEEEQAELMLGAPQQEAFNLGNKPLGNKSETPLVAEREPGRRPSAERPVKREPARDRRNAARDQSPVPEVVALHVMAPVGAPFRGDDLLGELMANELRYGSMKIFHRHQAAEGVGPILFSLANSVKPGTFDLNTMSDFSTPGVSFFMALDDVDDPSDAFEQMLGAAYNLSEGLGGELKDESRSAFTRQTEDHCRQRIKEFERRRLYRSTEL